MSFNKNGIIIFNNFYQISTPPCLSDDSKWIKIFYHNNQAGTVLFTSYDEVMESSAVNKYSRLKYINNFKAADGKFEFLLYYPNNSSTQYNRWKQTNNPCEEYDGTSDGSLYATGYEAIHIDWTSYYWGGLKRQNSSSTSIASCYLSGSVGHGNWFYAIGADTAWNEGIPAWSPAVTEATELWVRIDTMDSESLFKIYNNSIISNDIIEY